MTEVLARKQSAPARVTRTQTEYSKILATVRDAGLMGRRYGYYAVKVVLLLAALGAVGVGFVVAGDSWAQVAVAAALGVVLTQMMFLSHDAAHRQVFRSGPANEWMALLLGTAVGGVSLGWWNSKHTRHHSAPNQIGKDPDIDASVVHFYPADVPPRSWVGQFLHSRQGWWFFPLLVVEAINLHVQSLGSLLTGATTHRRGLELVLLLGRFVGYVAILFTFLPPGIAAAFLAVQLAVTGLYLGSVFAASHIGMPVVDRHVRVDFFRRQVVMSRNVRGGRVASVLMGGLNYQIEHHLFPSMPRPNLARAQLLVRPYCVLEGVEYSEVAIHRAWAIVARHLNRTGLRGRNPYLCPVAGALR